MLSLLDTPTGGLAEVLRALHLERGRATKEGGVDYHRLLRHLPPRIDTGDIDTILATAVGDGYATSSGSGFAITALGQTYVRTHGLRRSRITVV